MRAGCTVAAGNRIFAPDHFLARGLHTLATVPPVPPAAVPADPRRRASRPGFYLHRAARVEALAAVLVSQVAASPPPDPVEPVTVVVGSRGMERWVRHRLAMGACGIAANVAFPFPADALANAFALAPEGSAWSPARLGWAIVERLPHLLREPSTAADFAPVAGWLARAAEPVSLGAERTVDRDQLALARELAEVLDRAALFRPDWIEAWERGQAVEGPAAWQGHLWRDLRAQLPALPPTLALRAAVPQPGSAVHVFAVSSMPPAWIDAWRRVGQVREVRIYLVAPSGEYWGELRTERELRRSGGADRTRSEQNPLLTALGRLARDAQDLWLGADPVDVEVPGGFSPPPGDSALHHLQADVLAVRSTEDLAESRAERPLFPGDDSLAFHAAHGPTRQVEALRDALLHLLDRHPHLEPRHVLVMTPDVATYAPLVSAIFAEGYGSAHLAEGGARTWGPVGGPRLPLAVHDLGLRVLNPVADALIRVLELASGRLTAPVAMDLLALAPVRQRFGLDDDEIEAVRGWVEAAGARWGASAEERARHGNPPQHDFTFAFALDRMALGTVMADGGAEGAGSGPGAEWAGVAPFDPMEGQAVTLGKLAEFLGRVESARSSLGGPMPLAAWCAALESTVDALTRVSGAASFLRAEVSAGIRSLGDEAGEFSGHVTLPAMLALLEGRFDMGRGGDRPQSGAVTLCALQPMRSVPFPVVCLLGMDDGAFPRSPVGRGFDATLARPRPGDRDPREEDRNLLLEAILSARESLLVFYTGTDAHNGKPLAPCVPVGDLLDTIDATFSSDGRPREAITVHHAVQPFVPSGFVGGPGRPRRFDGRMAAAAVALGGPRSPWRGVLAVDQVVAAGEAPSTLNLDDLLRYTRQPLRTLAKSRLGLRVEGASGALPAAEALEFDHLEAWALGALVCRRWLGGHRHAPSEEAYLRARALLPPLAAGGALFAALWDRVEVAARAIPVGEARVHAVALPVAGLELVGSVVTRGGVVLDFGVESPDKPRRLLSAWIACLALAAVTGAQATALVVGEADGEARTLRLRSPDHPEVALAALVEAWRVARIRPVPVLEKCSYAAAGAAVKARAAASSEGMSHQDAAAAERAAALAAAQAAWVGRDGVGESHDATLAVVIGAEPPFVVDGELAPEFLAAAQSLWEPLLAALVEEA